MFESKVGFPRSEVWYPRVEMSVSFYLNLFYVLVVAENINYA